MKVNTCILYHAIFEHLMCMYIWTCMYANIFQIFQQKRYFISTIFQYVHRWCSFEGSQIYIQTYTIERKKPNSLSVCVCMHLFWRKTRSTKKKWNVTKMTQDRNWFETLAMLANWLKRGWNSSKKQLLNCMKRNHMERKTHSEQWELSRGEKLHTKITLTIYKTRFRMNAGVDKKNHFFTCIWKIPHLEPKWKAVNNHRLFDANTNIYAPFTSRHHRRILSKLYCTQFTFQPLNL